MGAVVGIDLGTTYSVVAHIDSSNRPEVIPVEGGQHTTPSVVSFRGPTPRVGADAKEDQANGDQEVASFFKRNMGNAYFTLSFNGREYTPTDLSKLVLAYLKGQAEAFLHEPVTDSVITVPAYFMDAQRKETMEAGRLAGLHVLAIINEPTAAAMAYGMRPSANEQYVLVYDLGGGTFDVSIVKITPTELRVIATDGDQNLGGKDWDDRLIAYLQQQFQDEFHVDLVGDDFNQLLVKAEELKRSLSAKTSASITVTAEGHTVTYTVSRDQFAAMSSDLLTRTQQLTEAALKAARLTWDQISGVLPVGGSTKMPMVGEWVQKMSGKPLMTGVNPDEAVGIGAAIWAEVEMEKQQPQRVRLLPSGAPTPSARRLLLDRAPTDVIAHTLGLIAQSGDGQRFVNSHIIRKNSVIPTSMTRDFDMRMRNDGLTRQEVFLTQGENDSPFDCSYLGLYEFTNFPAVSAPNVKVDVTYTYDANGTVQVQATERSTRQLLQMTVKPLPDDVPARFAGNPSAQQTHEQLIVYLSFDLSGSMSGSPLADAQRAAHDFVSQCQMETTAIGLIGFSDSVQLYQIATHSQREINSAIDQLRACATGGGNSGHPFDKFYELLQQVQGRRYGLVLADGMWASQDYDIQRAKRCHDAGIDIIAIGFGSADERFLDAIASQHGLSFFTTQGGLGATFSTIAREISSH